MHIRALAPLKMKTLLCAAAASFVLPSAGLAQSIRGSNSAPTITAAQINPIVANSNPVQLAQNLDQTTNYSVQPVYVDGNNAPIGGGDLASPVYTSVQASATSETSSGETGSFAPMPTGTVVQSSQILAQNGAGSVDDPNNGLVKVDMVKVGESVTTTTTRTTQLAHSGNGGVSLADGFGWRLNALNPSSANLPLGLAGDMGAMAVFQPNWEGSAEHMIMALPYLDVQLGRRVYLSSDKGLGVNLLASRNASLSFAADYRFPREDLDVLEPLTRKTGALTLGSRLNLYVEQLELFLNADYGVVGDMRGWDVELGLSSVVPLTDRLALKLTGSVTGADEKLINNMFEVTASDAATLGIPQFSADRFGLKDMRVKGELKYFFTDHIGIYGASQVKVLLDQAAESPLVDDLGEAVQFSSNLGLIYRF